MSNAHQVVINHVGEIISWKAIRFQQHLVIQLGMVDADFTIDVVKKTAHTRVRNSLPYNRQNALVKVCLDFFRGEVATWIPVTLHALAGHLQ